MKTMLNKIITLSIMATITCGSMLAVSFGFRNDLYKPAEVAVAYNVGDNNIQFERFTIPGRIAGRNSDGNVYILNSNIDIIGFEVKAGDEFSKVEFENRYENERNFKIVRDANGKITVVAWK